MGIASPLLAAKNPHQTCSLPRYLNPARRVSPFPRSCSGALDTPRGVACGAVFFFHLLLVHYALCHSPLPPPQVERRTFTEIPLRHAHPLAPPALFTPAQLPSAQPEQQLCTRLFVHGPLHLCCLQQFPAARQFPRPLTARQQAVMSNPHVTRW
jgi:hypothetical protein